MDSFSSYKLVIASCRLVKKGEIFSAFARAVYSLVVKRSSGKRQGKLLEIPTRVSQMDLVGGDFLLEAL